MLNQQFNAIDIFSGCGGLSQGLQEAGFNVLAAIDSNENSCKSYKINHLEVVVFNADIRSIKSNEIKELLCDKTLHLLAGCPPCQGFSSIRRLNRKDAVSDDRNSLILEFQRLVIDLKPLTVMMENVPGLIHYDLFLQFVDKLREALGYHVDYRVVNIHKYGVPQRRQRLVLVASKLGKIQIAEETGEKVTVRETIGQLQKQQETEDLLHKISTTHTDRINEMIKLIPKDGGSRKDLSPEWVLKCHKNKHIGFNDVYGRLKWDDYSSTITGGCLNPSKGRFLHPEEDRCITPREAALLQTFPLDYKFDTAIPKHDIALMIGNALPPKFARIQSQHVLNHIKKYYVR